MSDDVHAALYERALKLAPAGVNSPVRAWKSVGGTPRYIKRAAGAYMYGEGGERWVDYCMAWGPNILGHAPPAVVDAVAEAAADGLAFGAVTRGEIELAERILVGYPFFDRARLVCTGTEAVLTALRLARAKTGRTRILKFAGCYHGHGDSMLVKAGSGLVTFGIGDSAGVSAATAAETIVAPLDDESAIDAAFAQFGDDIAAAIIEPVPANNGLLVQRPEWHRHLRAACTKHGALLIHDEVITGFRFGYGGAGRLLRDDHGAPAIGVEPDLVTLGKIVGGGMPVAAVIGPAAILDQLAPAGPVYQAGTMAGNPVAVAAGNATLAALGDGTVYAHLAALGAVFDEAVAALVVALPGAPAWVRVGPVVWPWLGEGEPPRTDAAIPSSVRGPFGRAHARLLAEGIHLPPSAFEVGFFSAAHTVAQVRELAAAFAGAIAGGA